MSTVLYRSLLISLLLIIGRNFAQNAESVGQLPHCPNDNDDKGFILVSTLDGCLTSLDVDGNFRWKVDTDPGPLLTSNIHNVELTNNGEWVRIIPSLTGSLYKFNGKTIDAIPITADNLLKSSFMYSNDLVIAGGRDVRTYGVSVNSGVIIYECSTDGCLNKTEATDFENIVLIERSTTTVRAHEPRTGSERWNFSVGYHNVKVPQASCIGLDPEILALNLTAVLPKGQVIARRTGSNEVLWMVQFSTPIVKMWKWDGRDMVPIDLFSQAKPVQPAADLSPAIYLGMHRKQLYIYESMRMLDALQVVNYPSTEVIESKSLARFPWKPISADEVEEPNDDSMALSVLYSSEYVNGHGYYFYTEGDIEMSNKIECKSNSTRRRIDRIISVTFSFYWKEILIIISSGLVFLFWNVHLKSRKTSKEILPSTVTHSITPSTAPQSSEPRMERTFSESSSDNSSTFVSRFAKDFDTVRCLGRGGFGIVFEVNSKIDECGYAIKRIMLSPEVETRDRVLREVKALAKLDHPNIVRYSTSWVESPPPGWTYTHDHQFVGDESATTLTEPVKKKHVRSRSFAISIEDDSFSKQKLNSQESFEICFLESTGNSTASRAAETELSEMTAPSQAPPNDDHSISFLYIQMQLCKKESLKDWLMDTRRREHDVILNIFDQILSAVMYIHRQQLIHRDLKPSNIFFSIEGDVKVGDFGLVTAMKSVELDNSHVSPVRSYTKGAGTYLYMSPEQLAGMQYDHKVDIFSLGVILFELLIPFSTESERCTVLDTLRKGKFPANFQQKHSREYDLLNRMLADNPNDRPDAATVKKLVDMNRDGNSKKQKSVSVAESDHYSLPVDLMM